MKRFAGEIGKQVAKSTGAAVVDGQVTAVDGIDLEIADGEFFSMLGPSGSGKTTTLRMIAGFELPTSGRILLDGEDVSKRPPFERDVNTVFQDYALFPHMTVGDNVGYGLMIRKISKAERERRVGDALAMVRLTGYERRRPGQLSGGQRQRVAIARALVVDPRVLILDDATASVDATTEARIREGLREAMRNRTTIIIAHRLSTIALARALILRPRLLLLDEPLGALDLKLREEMQLELKAIQQEVGITFVYVTHDQEEALTMSDRLAVFNKGRIEQVGTPADVYERPATRFVAGFVGTSNLLSGAVAESIVGKRGTFTVRPEKIRLGQPGDPVGTDESSALGTVRRVVYLGSDTRYLVTLDAGAELVVTQQNLATSSMEALEAQGRPVRLIWKQAHNFAVADAASADGPGK